MNYTWNVARMSQWIKNFPSTLILPDNFFGQLLYTRNYDLFYLSSTIRHCISLQYHDFTLTLPLTPIRNYQKHPIYIIPLRSFISNQKKKKKKKNLPFETLSREHERELKFKINLPSAFPPFHLLKKRKNNESILIIRCKDSPFPQKKGEAERKERSEEFSTGAQSLRWGIFGGKRRRRRWKEERWKEGNVE